MQKLNQLFCLMSLLINLFICGACGSILQNNSQTQSTDHIKYFALFSGFHSCGSVNKVPLSHVASVSEHPQPMLSYLKHELEDSFFTVTCFDLLGNLYYSHGLVSKGEVQVLEGGKITYHHATSKNPLGAGITTLFEDILDRYKNIKATNIVVVGFSWGGWTSLKFSQYLAHLNIPVTLQVSVDPISKLHCSVITVAPATLLPMHNCKRFPYDMADEETLNLLMANSGTWLNFYQTSQKMMHSSAVPIEEMGSSQYLGHISLSPEFRTKEDAISNALPEVYNVEISGHFYNTLAQSKQKIRHDTLIFAPEIWTAFAETLKTGTPNY